MNRVAFSLITSFLILMSCNRQVSSGRTNVSVITHQTAPAIWSTTPLSTSSRIKVATNQPSSVLQNILVTGLPRMGFPIVQNTGSYLETKSYQAETQSVRVKAWIEEQSVILSSEVETFSQSNYGLPESTGFIPCSKGNSTYGSECWRTILVLANHIEGTQYYQ
ncbi:hypothetical protein [Reichenbachiella sp. MALMAid0571]|uniref:hypothetical protein n=1 Tax=Reichenbachiella sp. MALMAid0571 TaxID=3143939 RepID=UPI0032DEA5F3